MTMYSRNTPNDGRPLVNSRHGDTQYFVLLGFTVLKYKWLNANKQHHNDKEDCPPRECASNSSSIDLRCILEHHYHTHIEKTIQDNQPLFDSALAFSFVKKLKIGSHS